MIRGDYNTDPQILKRGLGFWQRPREAQFPLRNVEYAAQRSLIAGVREDRQNGYSNGRACDHRVPS